MQELDGRGASSMDDALPTEELYIELRSLEAKADALPDVASKPSEPSPAVAEDDPTGLKARIARLRALLNDRGAE